MKKYCNYLMLRYFLLLAIIIIILYTPLFNSAQQPPIAQIPALTTTGSVGNAPHNFVYTPETVTSYYQPLLKPRDFHFIDNVPDNNFGYRPFIFRKNKLIDEPFYTDVYTMTPGEDVSTVSDIAPMWWQPEKYILNA